MKNLPSPLINYAAEIRSTKKDAFISSERLKTTTAFLLSIVQMLADGAQSAAEVIQNFSSWSHYGKYMAFSAATVEGEVYRKNIEGGWALFKFVAKEKYLFHLLLSSLKENPALIYYYFVLTQSLTSDSYLSSVLTKILEEKEKKLKEKSVLLANNNLQPGEGQDDQQESLSNQEVDSLKKEIEVLTKLLSDKFFVEGKFERHLLIAEIEKNYFPTLSRKNFDLRIALASSILLALASSVALYCIAPTVLTALGVAAVFMPYIIIPLVIFSAISGIFLIYNTLADVIIENKWPTLSALKHWLTRKENESRLRYFLRIGLAFLAVGVSLAAVVVSCYTTYAQALPVLGMIAAIVVALPCALGELIFIMKNSLESINMLVKPNKKGHQHEFLATVKEVFERFKNQLISENILQWPLHLIRLPLQLVLFVFKLAVLFCHVTFTAIAADRCFEMPHWFAALISGISELLTDIFPLFSSHDDEADHDHGHDHDHGGGIFGFIQKVLFIIPAITLGFFNFLFSQLNLFKCFNSNTEKKVLSFKEAINKETTLLGTFILFKETPIENKKEIDSDNLIRSHLDWLSVELINEYIKSYIEKIPKEEMPLLEHEVPVKVPTKEAITKKMLSDKKIGALQKFWSKASPATFQPANCEQEAATRPESSIPSLATG